jgi:hypothetical protein
VLGYVSLPFCFSSSIASLLALVDPGPFRPTSAASCEAKLLTLVLFSRLLTTSLPLRRLQEGHLPQLHTDIQTPMLEPVVLLLAECESCAHFTLNCLIWLDMLQYSQLLIVNSRHLVTDLPIREAVL